MELSQNEILAILQKIQKNTETVPVIQEKLDKLEEFEREHPHTTIELVKNNRELDNIFAASALSRFKSYLDSEEARKKLSVNTIKEIKAYLNDNDTGKKQILALISDYFRSEYLRATMWLLGVFGTVLSIVFTIIVYEIVGVK